MKLIKFSSVRGLTGDVYALGSRGVPDEVCTLECQNTDGGLVLQWYGVEWSRGRELLWGGQVNSPLPPAATSKVTAAEPGKS